MSLNELSLRIPTEHMANVFGQFDANIKKIERTLGVTVVVRDDQLKIIGTPSATSGAQEVFEQLYELAKRGNVISEQNVNYALALLQEHKGSEMVEMDKDVICHTIQGKPVKPKTLGQKDYVDNIRKKMIVFGTRSQFPVLPEIQGRQGNCLHGGHHDSDGSADYADLFRDFLRDGVPDPLCIAWFDSCVDHLFCRACDL